MMHRCESVEQYDTLWFVPVLSICNFMISVLVSGLRSDNQVITVSVRQTDLAQSPASNS
jgi:hypothetical protein